MDEQPAGNEPDEPVEGEWSPRQEAVAVRLAVGVTRTDAAIEVGVTRRTIVRWLQNPAYKDYVRAIADLGFQLLLADMLQTSRKARLVIDQLLESGSDSIRVRAALGALTSTAGLRNQQEILQQITALKRRVKYLAQRNQT